jgi:hypothetical protein
MADVGFSPHFSGALKNADTKPAASPQGHIFNIPFCQSTPGILKREGLSGLQPVFFDLKVRA